VYKRPLYQIVESNLIEKIDFSTESERSTGYNYYSTSFGYQRSLGHGHADLITGVVLVWVRGRPSFPQPPVFATDASFNPITRQRWLTLNWHYCGTIAQLCYLALDSRHIPRASPPPPREIFG